MNYKEVDMEQWPRRSHYLYYTQKLKIDFNLTAPVDVKPFVDYCHLHGYKFYPSIIYVVTKTVNRIENFRMFKNEQGRLCVWDKIIPNYTIFHPDDQTFSDCWSDYTEDFDVCYREIMNDMQTYKDQKGIKAKEGQPPYFYCISCVPWISFTGLSSRAAGQDPSFFPLVTVGRYEMEETKAMMPVSITAAHAVCDGYHAGLFFKYLQDELRRFGPQPDEM